MDEESRRELDSTFHMIHQLQQAFRRHDARRRQQKAQDTKSIYSCDQCDWQSVHGPCPTHHHSSK